jgi:hypothetical protein
VTTKAKTRHKSTAKKPQKSVPAPTSGKTAPVPENVTTPPLQVTEVRPVNQGRHSSRCTICSHSQHDEIDQAFLNWTAPSRLALEYSVSRDSIYRHAHALGLMEKRRRNLRAALDHIVEKAGEVEVNAAAVVSAVSALARINSRGEWVERTQTVNLNALFERMTAEELEAYAKDGTLPAWFEGTVTATDLDSRGGQNE